MTKFDDKMTKFGVLWRTLAHKVTFSVKFSFYIPNDLKQIFYVTNNVNLCFGVTSSRPSPSSLRKLPNGIQVAWRKPILVIAQLV